ncbi:MAG: hypothetical protein KJ737_26380 [Proteobacteria bacterium]|nr:hypothetical protein [Pseudomonadota bacterium]
MTQLFKYFRHACIGVAAAIFIWGSGVATAVEYQSIYQSIRPLGMGGAFTAVADDKNALYYNPAGLSHISEFRVGMDTVFEMSESGIGLISDIQDTDFENEAEVSTFLQDYVGDVQYIRFSLAPQLGMRVKDAGVMVSGLAQAKVTAEVFNPPWPNLLAGIIVDAGVIGGAGMELEAVEGLRVGVAAKFIRRENLYKVYTPTDIVNENFDPFEEDRESGSGLSLDLGVIYRLPFVERIDTDVAICFQNFPEMDMGDAVGIDSQINIGIAVNKDINDFHVTGAFDIRDLTNNLGSVDDVNVDDDLAKRMYMGAEVRFPKILALRAGLHQGYMSFGATADLTFISFDFASYVEEIGAYAGQRDDRRYVAQLTLGW